MKVLTLVSADNSVSFEFDEISVREMLKVKFVNHATKKKEIVKEIYYGKNFKEELCTIIKGIMDEGFKLKRIDKKFNEWLSSDEIGSGAYFITEKTIEKELVSRDEGLLNAILNKVNELGGCDAKDDYTKGWDDAINTVYGSIEAIGR